MKFEEINVEKIQELKVKTMNLKDERQKGKRIYKGYPIYG